MTAFLGRVISWLTCWLPISSRRSKGNSSCGRSNEYGKAISVTITTQHNKSNNSINNHNESDDNDRKSAKKRLQHFTLTNETRLAVAATRRSLQLTVTSPSHLSHPYPPHPQNDGELSWHSATRVPHTEKSELTLTFWSIFSAPRHLRHPCSPFYPLPPATFSELSFCQCGQF